MPDPRWKSCALLILFSSAGLLVYPAMRTPAAVSQDSYLGFDRNDYPGDEALPILRKTFSFTSFWLGPPPGEKSSTWIGKREKLRGQGFGFVLLYNARESQSLKSQGDAQKQGELDGAEAARLAHQEGFPRGSVIFLDIEEGGRLSAAQHTYVNAWTDTVTAGLFRPGVYCSAMPINEGDGVTITTVRDLEDHLAGRKLVFWVFNYGCPPAPGCTFATTPPGVVQGGWPRAVVWQYAQSPRPKAYTARCAATYAKDGNCYAPGDAGHKWSLDANVSDSPDPSAPRE